MEGSQLRSLGGRKRSKLSDSLLPTFNPLRFLAESLKAKAAARKEVKHLAKLQQEREAYELEKKRKEEAAKEAARINLLSVQMQEDVVNISTEMTRLGGSKRKMTVKGKDGTPTGRASRGSSR